MLAGDTYWLPLVGLWIETAGAALEMKVTLTAEEVNESP